MLRIGFLVPVKAPNISIHSHIYELLNHFSDNINKKYIYNFYIGFNNNDKCLKETDILNRFNNEYLKIHIIEFEQNIAPGHVTKMWNKLFEISYVENDYFYQLGDDIVFDNYDFLDEYINELNKINNIGVTGYLTKNGNNGILTQSFVSKKHFQIFGYYFPETIKNWYCDNWISDVYRKFQLYKPLKYLIRNNGGAERYKITNDIKVANDETQIGICTLKSYLQALKHNSN